MEHLKTSYLGIELKTPIIVGACNLSENPDTLKKLEEAGVAAVVYKSLFEEQINLENYMLHESLEEFNERHAEMIRLFPNIEHAGPKVFLYELEKIKKISSIPVIGSLNAILKENWVDYAKLLEQTGVDALELNFYSIQKDFDTDPIAVEEEQIHILKEIKKAVSIPISVKLSPFYTSRLNFIKKMDEVGVGGFVLFNKLFQPDIDIDIEKHVFFEALSSEHDNRLAQRFAGLLFGNINAAICASTGILNGSDVIKMILAGADCVQVVSTLYRNGPEYIQTILNDIGQWMQSKNYKQINDFKGKLSKANLKDPFAYLRVQYVDILLHNEEIIKRHLNM